MATPIDRSTQSANTSNTGARVVSNLPQNIAPIGNNNPPPVLPILLEPVRSVNSPSLIGQTIFNTSFIPSGAAGTVNGSQVQLGGLSGVTYDPVNDHYYSISDDRSSIAPARFYTFTLNKESGAATITNVTPIKDFNGNFFAANSLDPEGIALTRNGTVFISSEGEVSPSLGRVTNPFVKEFDLATGKEVRSLTVPSKFLPVVTDTNSNGIIDMPDTQTAGVRNNLAFESLTLSPDQKTLFTATENALFQDGVVSDVNNSTRSRIVQFNLATGLAEKEYLYITDPVVNPPNPATAFATNGLVDLLAIDNRGTLLSLERSFSTGIPGTGNTIKIYEIKLPGATDISQTQSLSSLSPTQLAAIAPVQKRLLLNLDSLGLPSGLDNVEGITFGQKFADGRQSIVLVADNNFSSTQFTQILTLSAELTPNPAPPNGIASGDITQNSAVLWTRTNNPGTVRFEYSTKPDFSTISGSATATVTTPFPPVKVNITGLTPGTTYFYRATDATGVTTGKFSTPAAAGTQAGLTFGVAGDWRGELAPYPAIANADDRDLKFFVELGDTVYADFPSLALRNPNGTEKNQALTLNDYRFKQNEIYASRFGQNNFADLRASTAVFSTIDDHEVVNDFQGGLDLAKATPTIQALYGATSGLVNDSPLYDNGLQAFQEFNPIQDQFYGQTGDPRTAGERKLYRATTYGSDAVSILLDARSFRDPGLTDVANLSDQAQIGNFLAQSFNPNRTFLGRVQVDDLKRDLLQAQKDGVTWKFVNLPEPGQNLGVLAASDRYEGYAAERTEILKFINDNKINNVVFIAADIHGTLVNNLTYQLAPGQPQIATNAFEITTGSVAFDAPFGPTVANLALGVGILTPTAKAFYDSLPVANDADSLLNDKDDFIKKVVDDGLAPLGYDPLGLNNNLPQANGLIRAKLLQGDYVATQTYGWTEFNVDAKTQKLTATTYGITPYTRAEMATNPIGVSSRQPRIVSQFEVEANPVFVAPKVVTTGVTSGDDVLIATSGAAFDGRSNVVFTGAGNDKVDIAANSAFSVGTNYIDLGTGNDTITVCQADRVFGRAGDDIFDASRGRGFNRMAGGAGNDQFILGGGDIALGGNGNDKFFVRTGGGNVMTGGAGADQFWIADKVIPTAPNTITDFQVGVDAIGIIGSASLGITSANLSLRQIGADTAIGFGGQILALLTGIQASSLNPTNPNQFVFA